jgi:hypothetical protein
MEVENKIPKTKGNKASIKGTKKSNKNNVELQEEIVTQQEIILQEEVTEIIHNIPNNTENTENNIENTEDNIESTENNIEDIEHKIDETSISLMENEKNKILMYISNINDFYINLNKYNLKKIDFNLEESKIIKNTMASIGSQREKFLVKIIEHDWNDKKTKKSSKNKDGSEIKKDTSNHAVNKKKKVYKEVLTFMELENDTLVSRTDVHKAITTYVKEQRKDNPNEINVQDDKKKFNLIGKLLTLFQFLFEIGREKGTISIETQFPSQLANTDIMKYTSLCFLPEEKNNSEEV